MGATLGKSDGNATNDLDAAGNIVGTGTGVKTVADPNKGLTDDQMRNRKLASLGARTLGAVAAQPGDAGGGGATQQFTFANNQPAYQAPQPPNNLMPMTNKPKNPFFGY